MKRIFQLGVLGCLVFLATSGLQPGPRLAAQSRPQIITPQGGGYPQSNYAADPLVQLSDRFEMIASRVLPAVVSVEAVKPGKTAANGTKGRQVEESGSGVIIKIDGRQGYYVLTNNHVIAQATAENITIHLADGRILRPTRIWA